MIQEETKSEAESVQTVLRLTRLIPHGRWAISSNVQDTDVVVIKGLTISRHAATRDDEIDQLAYYLSIPGVSSPLQRYPGVRVLVIWFDEKSRYEGFRLWRPSYLSMVEQTLRDHLVLEELASL